MIELVREYWDRRPCNVRHSPSPVGTRAYFDEVEQRRYFVEPHIPVFARFEHWRDKKVLEIGCGIGTDTVNFALAGAQATAVDLSEKSLAIARQRADIYDVSDRINFYLADAEHLSEHVPVEPYDLVYSFGVLHHTPNPRRAVEELLKFVRPGGIVKLMLYYRWSWKVLGILIRQARGKFWQLDEYIARHSEAQTGCPVTYTYSKKQAKNLLQPLIIEEMHVDHVFPYRVEDYVKHRYVVDRPWSWLPASVTSQIRRRFGWHLCITARG